MSDLYALISLLSLLLASFFLTRMFAPRSRVDGALILTVVWSTLIVLLGYALSEMNQLRSLACWAALSLLVGALATAPLLLNTRLRTQCLRPLASPRDLAQRIRAAGFRRFDTLLLLALAVTMTITALANLIVIIGLEPANIDAIYYHLARIMYYLQHGNLHFFHSSNWAEVLHAKVSTVLMLYTYLIGGLNAKLTPLVQYAAYFVSVLAVYGCSRLLGMSRRRSAFAALIFSLLTIVLMEAASAQNDLILTAFTGCVLYFLLAYRAVRTVKYLWLASIAFALALGVKGTMLLVLPSLLPVALFTLLPRKKKPLTPQLAKLGLGALGCVFALLVITLPAGYSDNLLRFGHPLGPKLVRTQHSFEGASANDLARYGCLNMLRYAADFAAIDGTYPTPWLKKLQWAQTRFPRWVLQQAHLDLTSRAGASYQFRYERRFLASENYSFWGVLGWLWVWPVVLLTLRGVKKAPGLRIFAMAALIYFVVQAFASPYDLFRGRFFTTAAVFAAPALAWSAFPRALIARLYLILVVSLGCATAIFAAFFRDSTFIFPFKDHGQVIPSSFMQGHYTQLTREMPGLRGPLLRYMQNVPDAAVVATDTNQIFIEYLLFGDRLSRRIIPLRTLAGTHLPLPPEAQYLLYTTGSPYAGQGDICICQTNPFCDALYLRKLKY